MTPLERARDAVILETAKIDRDARVSDLTDAEMKSIARAVIEAIREPSEGMLDAASHGAINSLWLGASYTQMIDAILSDTAPEGE